MDGRVSRTVLGAASHRSAPRATASGDTQPPRQDSDHGTRGPEVRKDPARESVVRLMIETLHDLVYQN